MVMVKVELGEVNTLEVEAGEGEANSSISIFDFLANFSILNLYEILAKSKGVEEEGEEEVGEVMKNNLIVLRR